MSLARKRVRLEGGRVISLRHETLHSREPTRMAVVVVISLVFASLHHPSFSGLFIGEEDLPTQGFSAEDPELARNAL